MAFASKMVALDALCFMQTKAIKVVIIKHENAFSSKVI